LGWVRKALEENRKRGEKEAKEQKSNSTP